MAIGRPIGIGKKRNAALKAVRKANGVIEFARRARRHDVCLFFRIAEQIHAHEHNTPVSGSQDFTPEVSPDDGVSSVRAAAHGPLAGC